MPDSAASLPPESYDMADEDLLRRAFELAYRARAHGNHPFGAVLVNADGTIALDAENTVVTDGDCTAHAELNLIRIAFRTLGPPCSGQTMFASS
jgi:tRNA(Arg) A34 adenosine deaminase TadA